MIKEYNDVFEWDGEEWINVTLSKNVMTRVKRISKNICLKADLNNKDITWLLEDRLHSFISRDTNIVDCNVTIDIRDEYLRPDYNISEIDGEIQVKIKGEDYYRAFGFHVENTP